MCTAWICRLMSKSWGIQEGVATGYLDHLVQSCEMWSVFPILLLSRNSAEENLNNPSKGDNGIRKAGVLKMFIA